jgi:DedD protein
MAEQPEVPESEAGSGEIRSKLMARLAIAGVLVAVLLGVLAFFDYLSTAPDEPEEPVFTKPVPVAPKKEASQPVTPAENLTAPPAPEKAEAPAEPPPPPLVETHQPAVVEAKPEAVVEKRPKFPLTVETGKKPVTPSPAAVPSPTPAPEATTAPSNILPAQRSTTPAEPSPAKPAARIVEAKPAPAVTTPPAVSRLFSGFLLQAGVFSSVQRAEELHARLTLSGVPSTLETRVQVGPFKTKQEAEAAQAKLKELGVETILVPPKGKN